MEDGWRYGLGPRGPSLNDPRFAKAKGRPRPPRARWLGAAAAGFMVALGAAVLATQSLVDAHWVLVAGGGLWLLASGLRYVWREFWRRPPSSPTDVEPSWWLQPMSRAQATVLGMPAIAATVLEWTTDSDYVALAWAFVGGGTLAATFHVLAYLRSDQSGSHRRFRPVEDDSGRKWRRYRWPRGARSLR